VIASLSCPSISSQCMNIANGNPVKLAQCKRIHMYYTHMHDAKN